MNVKMSELNEKRLKFFFPEEQLEMLVNDVVDNAITDFIVMIEHIDNAKFKEFYERMVSGEELSAL